MFASGSFVRSKRDDLGIGRVIVAYGDFATVEYFHSIDRRTRHEVPQRDLELVHPIPPQSACYYWDDEGKWHLGRIRRWDGNGGYEVALTGARVRHVAPADLYVTASPQNRHAPHDPLEALILRWFSEATFHTKRHDFVRHILTMRAATLSMTALSSSRVLLLPHQVEIARRVLEDPIQRYLLADEVGLGKTIEAGVVLRQFLLDAPDTRALVITPPFLGSQWRKELLVKFTLGDFAMNRVRRIGWDQLPSVRKEEAFGLVIIDEAHNVAGWANSADGAVRRRFEHIAAIAHKSPRLLLLSATPVLNNEPDFLAMLHLLDPAIYRLNDLPLFTARVRNRQGVGRLLLLLREGASPFIAKMQLGELQALKSTFAQDEVLAERVDRLRTTLETQTTSQVDLDAAIRSLRVHIGETYRLHRRMLRTRRETVDVEMLPRRCDTAVESDPLPSIAILDDDPRSTALDELIEAWRDAAATQEVSDDLASAKPGGQLADVLIVLLQASWASFQLLAAVLRSRLDRSKSPLVSEAFGAELANLLTTLRSFEGETKLLREMLAVIDEETKATRCVQLTQFIKDQCAVKETCKLVLFTSFRSVCRQLAEYLSAEFGEDFIACHDSGQSSEDIEEAVERFGANRECHVLVCDRSGEEGRNLQFVDWVVHYDVPLAPNRMEQRIGRVDRIGRTETLQSIVYTGAPGSVRNAWCRMLSRGFGVFSRSIAGLQFYVDRKLQELTGTLFREGASGVEALIDSVRQEVSEEQRKNAEQYALDEMDSIGRSGQEFIRRMNEFEAAPEAIAEAVNRWACDALGFHREELDLQQGIVRYQLGPKNLIPADQLPSWERLVSARGTYSRDVATRLRSVRLFRPGEPFVDALMRHAKTNEQGRAFAFWRMEAGWDPGEGSEWTGFRFNYIIEANLDRAGWVFEWAGMAQADRIAFERQADAFFPPLMKSIYVDTDAEPVSDERLLAVLRRPFHGRDDGGTDVTMDAEFSDLLDELIDPAQWKAICSAASEKAKETLRQDQTFVGMCRVRREHAERELLMRAERMRLRMNAESKLARGLTVTPRDMEVEDRLRQVLLNGIDNPHLRLDSTGLVIVAGTQPKARRR